VGLKANPPYKLAKREWFRLGGEVSEHQWRGILGVLKTRAGELDRDYLRNLPPFMMRVSPNHR
jgi:hypothetical protein